MAEASHSGPSQLQERLKQLAKAVVEGELRVDKEGIHLESKPANPARSACGDGRRFFAPAVFYHGMHDVEAQVVTSLELADWTRGWAGARCAPTQECRRRPKS